MPDVLIDGDYTRAKGVGSRDYTYPFRQNGDHVTAHFEQEFWQLKSTFTAGNFKIPHEELTDFYLISESEPVEFMAGLYKFRRTYSRIPAQQIVPGSRFITKPDLPGEFPQVSGNSLIVQPDPNVPRWVFYTQKTVTSDSGPPNANSPTGGTYTVTIGASTTAPIAFNASAATLQTALNALPSVSTYGSVTVTGSYTTGFTITFGTLTLATLDTAGMLPIPGVGAPQAVLKGVGAIPGTRSQRFIMAAPNGYGFDAAATFTITIFGQTTAAISAYASAATVKAALEALSNIGSGNATVTTPALLIINSGGWHIEFTVTISGAAQTVGVSGTSLTPLGSTATATPSGASAARITFTGVNLGARILYSAAHGITALAGIVVTQGADYRTIPAGFYTVDTDTITLSSTAGLAFSSPTLITAVGNQSGNSYVGGSKLTRVKRVTDFYLPGVTVGVATIDDIPLPTYEGDPDSMLTAIFDGDTDINYEVGELEFYRDGPIVQRTRTTLNASTL